MNMMKVKIIENNKEYDAELNLDNVQCIIENNDYSYIVTGYKFAKHLAGSYSRVIDMIKIINIDFDKSKFFSIKSGVNTYYINEKYIVLKDDHKFLLENGALVDVNEPLYY